MCGVLHMLTNIKYHILTFDAKKEGRIMQDKIKVAHIKALMSVKVLVSLLK